MGYLTYCAAFLGLVVAPEVLFAVIRKLRVLKAQPVNVVLSFSDTCPVCGEPVSKMVQARECCSRLIQPAVARLEAARSCVDLCMYLVTCQVLAGAVLRAHARGVAVRIITDGEMAFASGSAIPAFHAAGIPIRWKKSTTMMHNKFCVVDHPDRSQELGEGAGPGFLLAGSLNWTAQAWKGNWEHLLITSQPQLTGSAQRTFSRLWNSFHPFMLPCAYLLRTRGHIESSEEKDHIT